MEKKAYRTPKISVTKWEAADIITTSGITTAAAALTITTQDDGIKSVKYDDLAG